MNNAPDLQNASVESLMPQVADEFIERLNRGGQPDIEDYARRYPQIATFIRQMFPALQLMRLPAPEALATSDDSSEPANGTQCLGDFRILRQIGRGGMGIVYEAEQVSLGRRVALKVLPFAGALDARQLQRFKNEAQAAAHLQHQNIVPVYFVGCERSVHFFAMQFVDGQTLAQVIAELRRQQGKVASRVALAPGVASEDQPASRVASAPEAKIEDGGSKIQNGVSDPTPTGTYTPESDGSNGLKEEVKQPTIDDRCSDTIPAKPQSSTLNPRFSSFFRTVAQLGIQAAEAIDHAHQMGVIHRDIKPGNILLETNSPSPLGGEGWGEGATPRLWITDFGLAQFQAGAELTMTGDLIGTLRYMSPEQALAKRVIVDHRTDIYSLGATLYELLTLRPPYEGNDRQELLRRIAFEEPKPLRRINPRIPAELETIVLKALEKNPADRYATAKELADDLRRFLEDKPIHARRPTVRQRLSKWGRRHQTVVRSAMVLLALTTAGLAVSTFLIARERDAARAAGKKASQEAAISKAINEFITEDLLIQADPHNNPIVKQVTLLEVLDRAADKVGNRFRDQPLVEAALRTTIGDAYHGLGQYVKSEQHWRASLEIYRTQLGSGDLKTLLAMARVGHLLSWHLRHDEEAISFLRPSLDGFHRALGKDHPESLQTMGDLAHSYQELGHFAEALNLHEERLEISKDKLGPEHPDTLGSMIDLAGCYLVLGRYADALKLSEQAFAISRRVLGPEDGGTLKSMDVLSFTYCAIGRYADALKLQQETLTVCKAKLGPDHLDTLGRMGNLASTYSRLGRHADALKLEEETLALRKAKLGPDHLDTLSNMNGLANSYGALGRHVEALKLREETLALRKAKLGPDHPDTLKSMNNLANSYVALGRNADALKLREETLALRKAKLGPDHPDTLKSMNNLANSYAALGRNADALKLHEETLALQKAKLGFDHPETLRSMNDLAWLLAVCPDAKFRDPQRAVTLAKTAVELAPMNGAIWNTLGVAYYRSGDWKGAIEALKKSMQLRNGGDIFDWFFLAMAHFQLQHTEEARQEFAKAVAWMDKHQPQDQDLRRFRAEAAELLGIKEKPETENQKPEEKNQQLKGKEK